MSVRRRRINAPTTVAVSPGTASKASGATQTFTVALTNVHGASAGATGGDFIVSNANATIDPATGIATAVLVGTSDVNFIPGGEGSIGSLVRDGTPAVLTVTQGALFALEMVTEPVGGDAATPLTTQPVVFARDAAGNPFEGATVVATIVAGTGVLSGDTSVDTDADGLAEFTDLEIDAADDDFVLRFTSGAVTVDSEVFEVTAP